MTATSLLMLHLIAFLSWTLFSFIFSGLFSYSLERLKIWIHSLRGISCCSIFALTSKLKLLYMTDASSLLRLTYLPMNRTLSRSLWPSWTTTKYKTSHNSSLLSKISLNISKKTTKTKDMLQKNKNPYPCLILISINNKNSHIK